MRNLLALLGLAILLFAGIGYYKGWYNIQQDNGTVKVDINKDKVKSDVNDAEKRIEDAVKR